MEQELNMKNEISRRQFVEKMAWGCLGVSALPSLGNAAQIIPTAKGEHYGKAKNIIYIFLNGGASHLDTWDYKENPKANGGIKPSVLPTGEKISQYFPELAKHGDKFSIIRSMTSKNGSHEGGSYLMKTSYPRNGLTIHPTLGSLRFWLKEDKEKSIPDYVTILGNANSSEGYLDKKFGPLSILNPNEGVKFSKASVENSIFNKRVETLKALDGKFRKQYNIADVNNYSIVYDEALKLMQSKDLGAFDLNKESPADRDRYGRSTFGQACLLAKRLVKNNIGMVELNEGGWDMHNDIGDNMQRKSEYFDKAIAALFEDLAKEGLLKTTLVVITTEFGRTVDVSGAHNNNGLNQNSGRDHAPGAFSSIVGGLDLGGKVVGKTDEFGAKVVDRPVTINDFNSTLGHLMGINPEYVWMAPSINRPFTIGNKGHIVPEFA